MTFIGYEIGSKAYKFMCKDNSICIATHAWFDEEKFPRANSGDGSSKNKLKICPPSKNKDQKDDNYSTDPDTDSDHNNDDPHSKDSSDDTPSDLQEESSEEEEGFKSAEEEEVEDDLKPPTESSDDEKSSTGHSRRSSIHSSNEKSEESSKHGDEPDQGLQSNSDDLFKESEPEPGPSGPRRSSRAPKPVFKYGSAYGDKPTVQIEKEIRSERAWQKDIESKAKAMIKQAHNTFHDDLETLVKEGGNKSIHYLLAQAVHIEKNPRELQYRNILELKDSNPKSFQEWQTAMEAEIKALNDRNVWELVNRPQN
jgi:hypothetical protein